MTEPAVSTAPINTGEERCPAPGTGARKSRIQSRIHASAGKWTCSRPLTFFSNAL